MKEYSANQVAEMQNDESIVVLDVRTREERSQQRIENSLHIPLNELAERMKTLDKYRQKEIICYCRSGNRSLLAARMLQKGGFNSANMTGGIIEWNYLNLK